MEINEERNKKKNSSLVERGILVLLSGGFMMLLKGMVGLSLVEGCKMAFILILMSQLFLSVLMQIERQQKNKKATKYYVHYFVISFVVSMMGIVVEQKLHMYLVWMLGGWMFSILTKAYFGMIYQMLFCMLMALTAEMTMSEYCLQALFGVGMCFLVPYLRKVSNLGYVLVIGIISEGIVLGMQTQLQWKELLHIKSLGVLAVVFIELLISAMGAWLIQGIVVTKGFVFVKKGMKDFFAEEEELWDEGTFVRVGDLVKDNMEQPVSIQEEMKNKQELLRALKEQQQVVYSHSLQVAQLAKLAADVVGADVDICYWGAIFHEIGKLRGKDYIRYGIEICKEEEFPKEIQLVIEEHNVVNKDPSNMEAIVVMFADSIISMFERIKQPINLDQKKKMIAKVFLLRLEKGTLDKSGLTVLQYNALQQFFVEWVSKRELEA